MAVKPTKRILLWDFACSFLNFGMFLSDQGVGHFQSQNPTGALKRLLPNTD